MRTQHLTIAALAALFLATQVVFAAGKPLKIYILAGQSNMQGHALARTLPYMAENPKTKPLYDEFVGPDGQPRVYQQVRVAAFSEMDAWGNPKPKQTEKSGPLTVGFGSNLTDKNAFGPELGFGITMYEHLKQPILIIKTAWGGRSLIQDFRSPSSLALTPKLTAEEQAQAQQRENDWLAKKGKLIVKKYKLSGLDELKELRRTAEGRYYRLMVEHVKAVLADPGKYYPDYDPKAGYQIAGFVWFQGFNDLVSRTSYKAYGGFPAYGKFLACLIRDLRKDLSAPNMPVVIGVIGVGGPIADLPQKQRDSMEAFRQAMAAPASMPEFKGNVVAVQTAPFWPTDVAQAAAKVSALKQQVKKEAKAKRKSDPKITPQQLHVWQRTRLAELMKQNLTDKERHILKIGQGNQSYHYYGNSSCLGQIGAAFANALLKMH